MPIDLGGVDDRDVGRQRRPASGRDARLVADEDDVVLGVRARVGERAGDDLLGAVVAAHRVDGDADAGVRRPVGRADGAQVHGRDAGVTRSRARGRPSGLVLSSTAWRPPY